MDYQAIFVDRKEAQGQIVFVCNIYPLTKDRLARLSWVIGNAKRGMMATYEGLQWC